MRTHDITGFTGNITETGQASGSALAKYDAACHALAEACSVDEVKEIRDQAVAMAAYARQAKNHNLEADAVALRMRATRRLDQLRQAQKETVGLNAGAAGGGTKDGPRGLLISPRDLRPTLASQGIDKNLAHQARTLGALSEEEFARAVSDARAAASRTLKRVVNAAAIEQKREQHRARIEQGGTVDDLIALAATGFRAGVIYIDPPWPFETYSDQGRQRSPDRHYGTMTLDEIKALPISRLAAPNCAVLTWVTWPHMPSWMPVLDAWGVTYSGLGFDWIKTNANGAGLHWGAGYNTRQNPEACILARIGNPRRLNADVHSVIMAPVGAHSEKPEEGARRIERLFPGPYLELFARRPRDGWTAWGDELPAPTVTPADTAPSTATALTTITPTPTTVPPEGASRDDLDDIPEFLCRTKTGAAS